MICQHSTYFSTTTLSNTKNESIICMAYSCYRMMNVGLLGLLLHFKILQNGFGQYYIQGHHI